MSKAAEKMLTFLDLVKFEHSVFALPYAYIGAIYGAANIAAGKGWPTPAALVWVTVAMVGARSFAFVVNRAVDKEIDARNPRTALRAVPAGRIRAWELWVAAVVLLGVFLLAVYQLAPITHWLWPIPLAMFVVYPYLKRFTPLCHYWLGLCLGLGAAGGWAAVGAPMGNASPWLLTLAVAVWTGGFDIIYATQDYDCDVRDGIHSVPADYGIARALLITKISHAAAVVLFLAGGLVAGAGWAYVVAVVLAAALLWYENAIITPEDMSRVDSAFFTVNGMVAIVILAGVIVDRLLA